MSDYHDLRDATARRADIFIAEGVAVIRQLLVSKYPVRSLLLTPAKYEQLAPPADTPVYLAPSDVMAGVAGFNVHRGALAAADRLPLLPPGRLLTPAYGKVATGLVAVLEGINDHENLGALFRNAAAFGVDAVLLSPNCADPLYRRSVRVSMGQVLHVPWGRLDPWPETLSELKARSFRLLALTPDPSASPLTDVDPAGGRTAVLLGAEGPGLSTAVRDEADLAARIPIATSVDSLNVATAASIAFFWLAPRTI